MFVSLLAQRSQDAGYLVESFDMLRQTVLKAGSRKCPLHFIEKNNEWLGVLEGIPEVSPCFECVPEFRPVDPRPWEYGRLPFLAEPGLSPSVITFDDFAKQLITPIVHVPVEQLQVDHNHRKHFKTKPEKIE